LRGRNEVIVEILDHDAGELDVLFFFNAIRQRTINALRAETHTQLSDDKIAPRLQKLSISRKKLKEILHERGEVIIAAIS